jgi:hypothetical protein
MVDERIDIIQTTTRMAVLADARRWDDLVDLFTDEVRVDYTSLNGGEPATLPAHQLVKTWTESLGRLGATQHLVADHLVDLDGDVATVTAAFQATHVAVAPDPRRWVLGGDYRYELVRAGAGWRIAGLTMTARWQDGDRSVLEPDTGGGATR